MAYLEPSRSATLRRTQSIVAKNSATSALRPVNAPQIALTRGDSTLMWTNAVTPETATVASLTSQRASIGSVPRRFDRSDVPESARDQDRERRPGDAIETPRCGTGNVGAMCSQHRNEPGQGQLAANPNRRGQYVNEESKRGTRDGQHNVCHANTLGRLSTRRHEPPVTSRNGVQPICSAATSRG